MLVEVQESPVEEKLSCYHCGDECLVPIQHEDKTFCCHGCKTVYEILAESGLSDYYSIEGTPGFKQLSHQLRDKYDFLDNSEIVHHLLDFQSDDFCKITFTIPTIHCSSCIWLLENLQSLSDGVISSQVNFPRKELTVSFAPKKISLKRLVETLAAVGYDPDINLEKKTDEKQTKKIGSLSLRIGVAAFCFGNIMLLSFPEYLGIDTDFDNYLKRVFLYLNFVLALPVVLFSATEYYLSAWKGIRHGYANIDVPIVLGITALFFRSSYEIFTGTGAGYLDSLAGLIFFLLVGKWFQSKTYMHLSFDRDYKSYFPLASKVEVENGFKLVMIKDLAIGNIVHVRNSEVVPADSVLLDDEAEIDYSFVTGESRSIRKEEKDFIYAGGRNVGKTIRVQVQKVVSQSFLTGLWNNEAFNKVENLNLRLVDRISKYFTFVIVVVALVSALFWHFKGNHDPFLIFTSVLIVACPCALALATPFTYGNVLRILGRNKFYLKNADIPELFRNVTHVIFDKTGTLTDISKYEVVYEGKPLLDLEWVHMRMAVENSTHPLSKRIHDYLKSFPRNGECIEDYREVPGSGIWAKIGTDRLAIGSASWVGKSDCSERSNTESSVHITINDEYVGRFTLKPAYKSGLSGMLTKVAKYFKQGVLSGDHNYDVARLKEYFPVSTPMKFEQSPEDKLAYVENLQKKGNSVIMLGDGLNDAAALKQANVGIAVTENASNFTPSCDAILEGSEMNRFHEFLSFIRMSKNVVIASFVLSFVYNFFGLGFAVSGNLTPIFAAILMPISSITVVAFSTLAVNLLGKKLRLL